jgi:hypothetical protein
VPHPGGRPKVEEKRKAPADRVTGGAWPNGDSTDADVIAGQEVARRLVAALGGRSYRSVGRDAGVTHSTIGDIVAGRVFGDFVSLVRLEVALGTRLWPDGHRG